MRMNFEIIIQARVNEGISVHFLSCFSILLFMDKILIYFVYNYSNSIVLVNEIQRALSFLRTILNLIGEFKLHSNNCPKVYLMFVCDTVE